MYNSLNDKASIERASRIPAVLRIGVTGHRNLEYPALISDTVRKVLEQLDSILKAELHNTPHTFMIISPLAEGSDRVVAKEILRWGGTGNGYRPFLEVVLPMPEDEYEKDFKSPASVLEFQEMLYQARSIKVIEKAASREDGFEKAGRYVVHGSDILIAVWNGKVAAGPGGTADIVAYARKDGHPLICIDSLSGEISHECDRERLLAPLRDLDEYNGKSVKPEEIEGFSASRDESFLSEALTSGLPKEVLLPIEKDLLPKYARASLLAKRYQRWYFRAGFLMYVMAVLAVATVAVGVLFSGNIYEAILELMPWLPLSEVGLELVFKGLEICEMLVILLMVWLTSRYGFHRQWIDYRFLAERIRAAIFFTIAGIRYEPLKYPAYLNKNKQSDYWIVKAFSWIWYATPRGSKIDDLQKLKNFLKMAWVDDQIAFYERGAKKQNRFNDRLEIASFGLFILTICAAAIPFIEVLLLDVSLVDIRYISLIGIVFPAGGASVAGYLALREFRKNSERYEQMVAPLKNISQQMEMAKDAKTVVSLVEDANALMLRENQDWRVNLLSQKLMP